MSQKRRYILAFLILCTMMAVGAAILKAGLYGYTIFVVFPLILGGLSTLTFSPATPGRAAGLGAMYATLGAFSLLALGFEGLICVAMCVPLTVPLGALGGWLTFRFWTSKLSPRAMMALLLIPTSTMTWDGAAHPSVYKVQSEIVIAATPEQVWKYVVRFPDIQQPREWFFRAGVAYPERVRLKGTGVGATRYCEFSTGDFVEPIDVWDEPRRLHFQVTNSPSPLNELSPYNIAPKHLHGYFRSVAGEFELIPLSNGQTLLRGTSWYQHGLWPAQYWRVWSDAIIHRIHLRVLNHIKTLAEAS